MWVYQVWAQYQETGQCSGFRTGGYRSSRLAGYDDSLRAWIKKEPDITLAELRLRLKGERIEIGIPALWHHLNQLGLTFKKTLHAAEQERPDVQGPRKDWKDGQG